MMSVVRSNSKVVTKLVYLQRRQKETM